MVRNSGVGKEYTQDEWEIYADRYKQAYYQQVAETEVWRDRAFGNLAEYEHMRWWHTPAESGLDNNLDAVGWLFVYFNEGVTMDSLP